jgi:hypothetical protein
MENEKLPRKYGPYNGPNSYSIDPKPNRDWPVPLSIDGDRPPIPTTKVEVHASIKTK